MTNFRFRKFPVYVLARSFNKQLKTVVKTAFPKEEQFNLISQICRAVDSVLLNIAEGSDRSTDKDFALFLNRAHTSVNEIVSCLDIALDAGYISKKKYENQVELAGSLIDQLTAFRNRLINRLTK